MKLIHVVGARPNFMKVSPVLRALRAHSVEQKLLHTGQHYDVNMSDIFFQQLDIPAPDINLEVGAGTQTEQTAAMMVRGEKVFTEQRPDMVLVYGDVNSTVAAALVCAKLRIRIAHVEAGLRSFDRSMPEEVNRLVTDQLSDLLFTPSEDGNVNLAREGIPPEKVKLVGNVMIDTLVRLLPAARPPQNVTVKERFVLVTLHRPGNVDQPARLKALIEALLDISKDLQVVFPVHPRTRGRMKELGYSIPANAQLYPTDPLGYLEFLNLQQRASVVLTDSGGVQEESTYLGVPCLTVRPNTERPVTISHGTNKLFGENFAELPAAVRNALSETRSRRTIPPLWDGKAAERIAAIIANGGN
jgi:UDP-N-acetylglucosamine 2-epimerase (non-hydrolysing)